MKTAAVIVDWRLPLDTLRALHSLASMKPAPDVLICVENGSTPEQVDLVREGAPAGTVILTSAQNRGFTGGVNLGMDAALRAGADWTLLLNNDAVVAPGCLGRALELAAADETVAVVGPAIAYLADPQRLWFAGGYVNEWLAYPRHIGLNRPISEVPPTSTTRYVSGCCALVSSVAWRSLGPFREDFFAYYEDVEWCSRARSSGWRCLFLGEVLCWHAVSASIGRRNSNGLTEGMAYYLARNPLRFAIETRPPLRRLTRLAGLLSIWTAYNGVRLLQARQGATARAYLEGMADAVMGRMGPRRPHTGYNTHTGSA